MSSTYFVSKNLMHSLPLRTEFFDLFQKELEKNPEEDLGEVLGLLV